MVSSAALPREASLLAAAAGLLVLVAGCGEPTDDAHTGAGDPVVDPDEPPRSLQMPLEEQLPCSVEVDGHGDVDIESDYIPNVVACENGAAPPAALRAQAVQARGYLYYQLVVNERDSVLDSTDDQVYDCDYTETTEIHYAAAEATRGEYLRWNDYIVAPFYVAGAIPENDPDTPVDQACIGTGDEDPTDTEEYVTYNRGLTGCDIEMTPLGWRPDDCMDNPHNRGCASQNGQACLAERGWQYDEMITYYYGDDIDLDVVDVACEPDEPTEADAHCRDRSEDGWSCLDDDRRLRCEDDEAVDEDDCPDGCTDGECVELSTGDEFCRDEADADGWHCKSDEMRIECDGDRMVATDACSDGCRPDGCLDGSDESEETISLVTESRGVDGGCTSTGSAPLPVAALALLAGLVAARRAGGSLRPAPTAAAGATLVAVGGCASVHPPVEAPTSDDNPRLQPLRADPEGLEFALRAPAASPDDELQIWRKSDGEWTKLEARPVDEDLADALRDGDARWRDDLDERPRRLDYRIRLVDTDDSLHSPAVDVDWRGWLQSTPVETDVGDDPSVTIHWGDDVRLEARILRRDVLADTGHDPIAIVDPAADNRFVDDDVEPGGIYTYRIQFVDRLADVPRFSPFVESRYVSIPDAPPEDGTTDRSRLHSGHTFDRCDPGPGRRR